MTNLEINKLLHEKVMGKCWHDFRGGVCCIYCGAEEDDNSSYTSSWADYGPMLERAERQIWWSIFAKDGLPAVEKLWFLLNPLRGSNALAEFITEHPEYFKEEPQMEDREQEIREYDGDGFSYGDINYLLSLIDSLRASQKELIEAGETLVTVGPVFSEDIRHLKETIEKAKEVL